MSTGKNNIMLPLLKTSTVVSWDTVASGVLIASLFISLVIVFCVILIRLYFSKIRKYTAALYQKDLDYQKDLKDTVMETQEQVLQHIAQDLHDDAGQQLTYLNFQIENLKLDHPEDAQKLVPLSESLAGLSASIRGISHALGNQLVMQQDLIKAIQSEVERLQKSPRVALNLHISGSDTHFLRPDDKIFVYRIFQESLNNIFKHARAKNVTISIRTEPVFEMIIADDGRGFDATASGQSGMGLRTMATRAEKIGFGFRITSKPEKGTTITLKQNI